MMMLDDVKPNCNQFTSSYYKWKRNYEAKRWYCGDEGVTIH